MKNKLVILLGFVCFLYEVNLIYFFMKDELPKDDLIRNSITVLLVFGIIVIYFIGEKKKS